MTAWTTCDGGFIAADVVRWEETAWERGRRGKLLNLGRRSVTAEVLEVDRDGWALLLVRASTVVSEMTGRRVAPLAKHDTVRRKRSTIERGNVERLLWSDESARTTIASKFLGPEHPPTRPRAPFPRR